MALDPMIARGVAPIDISNSLLQIGILKQRDEGLRQDAQRNDIYARMQQQNMDTAAAERTATQEIEHKKHALATAQWALKSGNPKAAMLQIPEAVAQFQSKGVDINTLDDAHVQQGLQSMVAKLSAELGIGPPEDVNETKIGQFQPGDYTPDSLATFMQTRNPSDLVRYQAPVRSAAAEIPADQRLFEFYRGLSPEQRAQFDAMKGRTGGSTVTTGPDGETIITPGGKAAIPTEGERTSSNYFGRMQAAEQLLGDYVPSTKDYVASQNVMAGGATRAVVANAALSPEGQKYYQAAADWVRAKLRKESGAVISPDEMAQEIKTYFPVPNDMPETVAQKAQARQQAMTGMRDMSGRSLPPQPRSTPPASGKRTVKFGDL